MMLDVVDPTEPARDRSSNHDDARSPEIVDAEIVPEENSRQASVQRTDEPSGTQPPSALPAGSSEEGGKPGPSDDAEFRQYQQFLEFQRFQEWQRQHGTADAGGTTVPPRSGGGSRKTWAQRAWWLLRFKGVRRLLYLLILLLAAWMWINSTFGASNDDAGYVPGEPPPPPPQPILQSAPQDAIITVHDWVATKPDSACLLFSSQARDAFARAHNESSCDNAMRKINQRVAEPMIYKNPEFGEDAVQTVRGDAVVHSCRITVEGGPRLGDFGLSQQDSGGWIIDSYQRPGPCS